MDKVTMNRDSFIVNGRKGIAIYKGYALISIGASVIAIAVLFFYLSTGMLTHNNSENFANILWLCIGIFVVLQVLLFVRTVQNTMAIGVKCGNCNWRAFIIKNERDLNYLIASNKCPKCKLELISNA
jgi:hypothetical protein